MSPEYATELANYMPPTTTLTVRPAVEFLLCMRGNVRGLYAYNVGRTMDYGTNWWNSNISYGASATLLVKTLDTDGKVFLWSVDPIAKSYKQVGTMSSPLYNDDSVLYKHTLFLASGDSNTAMKLFHQQKGSSDFALRIGDEGQTEIGNMQNITSYKNFIFMSGNDSLNIYFIEAQYADILDPINSSFWKTVENLFSPKFGQTFSLDGICQNGGSILRLFNLSRGGADTISTYLAAITNIGEIILFEGSDPSDTTGQKWAVAGRFQIAPPLNKFCICEMEGDTIVATKNGLISLRRIVFGQANDITENLEYKIFSLFYQYQFNIPAYTNFIGLYYHPRNRLLIFNIPDSLPMPFVNVESGLSCFAGDRIVFLKDFFTDTVVNQITSYLYSFNVRNGIVTKVYIEIDGDYAKNSFCIDTTTDYVQGDATYNLFVDFYVMIEGVKQSLLQNVLTFEVNDPNITLKTPIAWNDNLKIYNEDRSDFQYAYIFPKDFTITNVLSDVKIYKEKMSDYTFATLAAADDLKPTPATSLTFFTNPYKSAEKKFYINAEDFFLSADNGCYLYNFQDPTTYPDGQKHFPPQITY
jgi:hypothetical protein